MDKHNGCSCDNLRVNAFDTPAVELSRRAVLCGLGGGLATAALAAAGASARPAFAAQPSGPGEGEIATRILGPGKVELRFPKDGVVRPGRHEFRDVDDLLDYLADLFPTHDDGSGLRGTIKRVGRYRRVDDRGQAIHTFGDPILDLITDPQGRLIVGGTPMDLRAQDAVAAAQSATGVRSSLEFRSGRARMRFRVFKRNYYVYWKIGAEIETWRGDFSTAQISSQYGVSTGGGSPLCAVARRDSDSDSNDDYLDEYEWGAGPGAIGDVKGVLSECTARWKGRRYRGVVGTGCSRGWV